MVDKALIQRKLTLLKDKQAELRRYNLKRYQDFLKTPYPKAVEKLLQEMVEICLDVGKHIISDEKLPMANDNHEIFETLAHHHVISRKILQTLHKMVGFRNHLVHMYELIDERTVFQVYKNQLSDFDRFAQEIARFIRR